MPRRQSGLSENTDIDNVDDKNVDGDNMRMRRPLYHNMMMMCNTEGRRCENWDSLGFFAFCHNFSNDDNDDVDYENEDDHPAKKTGGRKTETRKGGRGFGKATTNSELDQSLLLVHLHFFTLRHCRTILHHLQIFSNNFIPISNTTTNTEVLKKVGSLANNLGNNLDLPVPFDNQVDFFSPFDNQVN